VLINICAQMLPAGRCPGSRRPDAHHRRGIASASPPRPGQPDRVAGPSAVRSLPGLAGHPSGAGTGAAAPAATYAYAAFTSDTCTVATFGPHFECMATGYNIDHGIHALGMCWEQGMVMWNGCYPADAVAKNLVTLPLGVSCSSPNFTTCSLVGEHYDNPRYAAQIVEVYSNGGNVTIVNEKNPAGSTWSVLQDVSCPTPTFCLMVGAAGTSRRTSHGILYHGHATAYKWGGKRLTRLSVPLPGATGYSELAGVACANQATCMAVGNYITARGKWKTYSALWTGGSWHTAPARNVPGVKFTTFQAVACPATTTCMATGDTYPKPGSSRTRAFAERWTSGTWHMSAVPGLFHAGLTGVACPAINLCFAAGWHGNRGLIERWNGSSWAWQKSPRTPKPLAGDTLTHVSCVTEAECAAVGYRYNPAVRPARRPFRTLAELWNGHSWTLMRTFVR
jgi:hypothetical protein